MWSGAVFELYNIANAKDFLRLTAEAAAGKLSKEEFVAKMIECESCAAEKSRAFDICVFLPWAKEHRVSTCPEMWYLAGRSDPSQDILLGFRRRTDRIGRITNRST